MQTSLSVRCPNPDCQRVGKVPAHRQGRSVRCPQCHTSFVATASAVAHAAGIASQPASEYPPISRTPTSLARDTAVVPEPAAPVPSSPIIAPVPWYQQQAVFLAVVCAGGLGMILLAAVVTLAIAHFSQSPEPVEPTAAKLVPPQPDQPTAEQQLQQEQNKVSKALAEAQNKMEQLNRFVTSITAGQAAMSKQQYNLAVAAFQAAADIPGLEAANLQQAQQLLQQARAAQGQDRAHAAELEEQLTAYQQLLAAAKEARQGKQLEQAEIKLKAARKLEDVLIVRSKLAEADRQAEKLLQEVQDELQAQGAADRFSRLVQAGQKALKKMQYDEAIRAAQDALALKVAAPAEAAQLLKDSLLAAGADASLRKDYVRLLDLAKQLQESDPQNVQAARWQTDARLGLQQAAAPAKNPAPVNNLAPGAAVNNMAPNAGAGNPALANQPPVVIVNGASALDADLTDLQLELMGNEALREGRYDQVQAILTVLTKRGSQLAVQLRQNIYRRFFTRWRAALNARNFDLALNIAYQYANTTGDQNTAYYWVQTTRERWNLAQVAQQQQQQQAQIPQMPVQPQQMQPVRPNVIGIPNNQPVVDPWAKNRLPNGQNNVFVPNQMRPGQNQMQDPWIRKR